jgi:hypothetical protein
MRGTIPAMLRRLSLPAHGAVELGLGPAGLVACLTAGTLVTGLGLGAEMPISTHMAADTAIATAMIAVAVLVSAADPVAAGILAAAAAGELALGVCTRWTRRA